MIPTFGDLHREGGMTVSQEDRNVLEEHCTGRINIEDGLGHGHSLGFPHTKGRPAFNKT